jgi:hypothetical protein
MFRMPRSERVALQLANRRLDPGWRELHGLNTEEGAA